MDPSTGKQVGEKDRDPGFKNLETYRRRKQHAKAFALIEDKIEKLWEPRFICGPEEAELMECLIRMSESKNVLELGSYTGLTTLHLIRGVYPDGMVTAVDARPEHDEDFFAKPEIARCFRFIKDWTPQCLEPFVGKEVFDFIFVDTDHSLEHTEKERLMLWKITRPGSVFIFHDCQKRTAPDAGTDGPIYTYVYDLVRRGLFTGGVFQTPHRLDCLEAFGPGYSKDLLPHLGIFVRTDLVEEPQAATPRETYVVARQSDWTPTA